MRKYIFLALLVGGYLLSSCSSSQQASSNKEHIMDSMDSIKLKKHLQTQLRGEDFVWEVYQIGDKKFQSSDSRPNMSFKIDEWSVSGSSGCNRYFGSFSSEGLGEIRFSQMGATMMACPDMDIEQEFLQALEHVRTYAVEESGQQIKLLLSDSTMTPIIYLEGLPSQVNSLDRPSGWLLDSMGGEKVNKDLAISLQVNLSDKRISGKAPCNRYFGTIGLEDSDKISISHIGSTRMACPSLTMESQYLKALEQVKYYQIARDSETNVVQLKLLDSTRTALLSYKPEQ